MTQKGKYDKILKKIFTSQTLTIAIATFGLIVGIRQCKTYEDRHSIEEQKKSIEDSLKFHEKLILLLDMFQLESEKEYFIDEIISPTASFTSHIINICNQGKYDAKKASLIFGGDLKIVAIFSHPQILSNRIEEHRSTGSIFYDDIHPRYLFGTSILYHTQSLQTEDKYRYIYNFTCENKANPLSIEMQYEIFRFSNLDEYMHYLSSKHQNIDEYLENKDFIIDKTQDAEKIYKVIKESGKVQLQECVRQGPLSE